MTIIIVLLTILIKIVITIRVPTSWTDQIKQQSAQQLKPYGNHERHQNLNLQQHQNGWVPILPPPQRYYFTNPPPTKKSTKFKKTHPLSEKHAAKFGINHQENDRKPDGYEIFEKNSNLFNRKRAEFHQNRENLPKRFNLGRLLNTDENQDGDSTSTESTNLNKQHKISRIIKHHDEDRDGDGTESTNLPKHHKVGRLFKHHDDDEDRDEDNTSTEFTPTKFYTQVRHYNDRQHLPRDQAEDPRLREIIRDSRIHTIYTEEGYEDSGYDHAGHEKNAEEDAGYIEFDKDIESDRGNNGDLQISSEIKLVKSPKNNQTETHKYVKIAPKRNKRTINEKYPYYNHAGINQDSPLRYSENFVNIPDKQHDNLAFYHQADKIECDEIETDIDPIPERIENNEKVGDVDGELGKMPRLRQLGDKIDCFKLKYFGENPLDNPLFDEVTIGPVKSIFDLYSIQAEAVNSTINDESLGAKILNDIVKQQQQEQRKGKDLVNGESPMSEALLGKRRRRLKPKRPSLINRFPPTRRPFRTTTTTTTPATISEVHYKNDIKPDEQFNVLHDVINNIKNSAKEPLIVSASNFVYLTTSKTPTTKPKYPNLDAINYDNLELFKLPKITTTSTTEKQQAEIDLKFDVVGLSPPTPIRYQTINHKLDDKMAINQFYVDGMKPPPLQQKFYLYNDFKTKINQKQQQQRYRRAAQRSIYSQVVRNRNKPIDINDDEDDVVTTTDDDDDDDYVPHRPKNYHYDEKLGRIVYDQTTQTTVDKDDGIEEILITESPLPKPTRKTTIKFMKNPDEPSFLEFIKTLKSNSGYQQITEPPPMMDQKLITTTTTIRTTSVESLTTRLAGFLNVLSKIRTDPNYRRIDDKNATIQTTTTTTTTESSEEVPDEYIEEPVGNVQNSRGSGILTTGQNFQIFDINDYLPKIKNYSFRTSIDTTKYKTIERRKEPVETVEESRPELSEITTTTTIKPTTTTTVYRLRNRPKIPTITTTTERAESATVRPKISTTTTEKIESATVREEKPKRAYPRRRVARIRLTTTTTRTTEENATKIVHRRHQPETTTPTPTTTTTTTTEPNKKVTTFKDYDKTKRHGGNYRRQDDFNEKLSDVVLKPIMFYTDPTLPKNINRLAETNAKTTEDLIHNEYDDGEIDEIDDNDDENRKISKNTAFIKDPSQRLYYYAPI